MLDLNISNDIGPMLRNQLVNNFTIIDKALYGNGGVTQEQLDEAIAGIRNVAYTIMAGSDTGQSSVEVQTMRTNIDGHIFETASARLDVVERAIKKLGGTLNV